MSTLTPVLFAAPPAAVVDDTPWVSVRPRWTGWDGSVWDLADRSSPVLLTRDGIRGLSFPPFRRHVSKAAGVPGQRHRGYTSDARGVFWPVYVATGDGSQAFVELDRAFMRTMHPGKPGTWSVTHPDGQVRTLQLRFRDDGDHAFRMLPTITGWAKYGLTLDADHPYWAGEPVMREWHVGAPSNFFGTGGPPFTISSASTLAGASIENQGDEPAYPMWVADDVTTLSVGVGSRVVDVPFEVGPAETLVIDTRPTSRSAKVIPGTIPAGATAREVIAWVEARQDIAVSRTRDLGGGSAFAPIPEGEAASLSLDMVGSGTVRAVLEPIYHRAW